MGVCCWRANTREYISPPVKEAFGFKLLDIVLGFKLLDIVFGFRLLGIVFGFSLILEFRLPKLVFKGSTTGVEID